MNGHLGDRAAAYVDGALDASETARAEAHLAGCQACRSKVSEQQGVRELLRGASAGPVAVTPPSDLLASLASLPVAGLPVRAPEPAIAGPTRREAVRWGTVSGVAVGATVLVTAWGVGGQMVAAGPQAVRPDNLMAQHTATAGELPFWGSTTQSVSIGQPDDAATTLRRAAQASASVDFRGVELVATSKGSGLSTQVAEVSHFAHHGTSIQVVGGAASPGAPTFRPLSATATSTGVDPVALLDSSYVLVSEGTDQVAGRDTDRIAVYTAAGTLAARFWIDRASGLPLAREVRDSDGVPAEVTTFTAVAVDDPAVMPGHLPVATNVSWSDAASGTAPEALEAAGWVCPDDLAAATGLTAFDARLSQDSRGSQVLHLVFTDGLRSVSVFQQRGVLDESALAGFVPTEIGGRPVYRKAGVPDEVAWASGSMVFTVIGDTGPGAVDSVVAALPHAKVDTGSRTGRGLVRVGSWLDPFG